ncbi:hypothetical protein N219_12575 (plasmid) [Limosilactobacillus fermentum MTCC 8711]|nr:hypothetical protein N219_12575 [Limosilactobacillus fermentum MTCC 8711]
MYEYWVRYLWGNIYFFILPKFFLQLNIKKIGSQRKVND